MPKKSLPPARETGFYCSAEWHLAPLHPFCALLYPFALRLSKKSGRFTASAPAIGEHFGRCRETVLAACADLRDAGFFIAIAEPIGEPVIYKPITHRDWALANPDRCSLRQQFPWSGEGDPLAQQLWAASGSRVKFYANEIKCLRRTGIGEDELVRLWQSYYDAESEHSLADRFKSNRRGIKGRFLRMLRKGDLAPV